MYHFFADKNNISDTEIFITGEDFNHAVNVLRLKAGERVMISDPSGRDYMCSVGDVLRASGPEGAGEDCLKLLIEEICEENHELPAEIVLFQCLPKSDKMELIIQKAVELGVTRIVPVASKNCIVKLDDKKAASRVKRWQAIAESAAKQSKRSIIPEVSELLSFKQAIDSCEDFDVKLIPYEDEHGLTATCEAIVSLLPGRRIAVFIGPEGGFDPLEVSMAKRHDIVPVSLGKRILRTETAAIAVLSLIMIRLEIASGMDLGEE